MSKIDSKKYPFCALGHQYALDIVSKEITANIYVIGACNRYLEHYRIWSEAPVLAKYYFDLEKAEKYLRIVQKFEHVIGDWTPKNIKYEPWQCFTFLNIIGIYNRETGYRKYRIAHVEVSRGNGKAHTLNQLVPTPQGMKKWEEIGVGSELYGRDGKICKVVGKTPIEPFEVHEVHFSDGTVVETSGAHEWITSDKTERSRQGRHKSKPPTHPCTNRVYEGVRETSEIMGSLTYGVETNHSVLNTNPVEGRGDLFIDAYFLGYWLGNGSKGKVHCDIRDADELVSEFVSRGIDCNISDSPEISEYGATVNCRGIVVPFRENGISSSKEFKDEWLTLPKELRLDLLRGLIDSDGHIGKQGSVEFYSSTLSLAEGVRRLANSLGFKATRNVKNIPENNNFKTDKTHYRVLFSARGDVKVSILKRKRDRLVASRGTHTYTDKRYIKNVIKTERVEDMFCVEVDSVDNTYLISDSYIPTHNSLLASQAGLYFLAFDSPLGNKVACVASRKEQARIVLDSSRAMAKKSDAYRKKTGVTVLAHKIVNDSTFSEMRALSADSDGLDGLNDVLAILDELHVMKKAVFDVIYSGMSKRKDSLTLCITTAGFDMESVGYSQSVYAKKVATGEYEDEQFFSLPYTLDKDDDIYDPSVWIKANPNYGVSVDPLTFEAKAKKAKLTPSDVGNFKVKHLNIWLSEANAFFNMSKWDKCADPTLNQQDYLGLNGYVGLDLASKIDLTGLVTMVEKEGIFYIFEKAYIPEERVKELNMPLYTDAVGDGFLTATPGEVINYPKLQEDFKNLCFKKLKVKEAFYDPWNATEFSQRMLAERINMVEFRMNTANLSEPMKWLGAKIIEGKVRHNGSPLLRWCMSNVVAKVDGNDNVYPRKSHEKLKIDLAIALIMASAGYMQESQKKSVYATRGIRVL
tara:strand:- start:5893 stop:8646 length:2754 start_codon:yes stop_codon:yes gene_type:complete